MSTTPENTDTDSLNKEAEKQADIQKLTAVFIVIATFFKNILSDF